MALHPSSRKASWILFACGLPSTFGSLSSVCSLLRLVLVEEHLSSCLGSLHPGLAWLLYKLGAPSLCL